MRAGKEWQFERTNLTPMIRQCLGGSSEASCPDAEAAVSKVGVRYFGLALRRIVRMKWLGILFMAALLASAPGYGRAQQAKDTSPAQPQGVQLRAKRRVRPQASPRRQGRLTNRKRPRNWRQSSKKLPTCACKPRPDRRKRNACLSWRRRTCSCSKSVRRPSWPPWKKPRKALGARKKSRWIRPWKA